VPGVRELAAALTLAVALSISAASLAAAPGGNVPDVETRRSGLTLAPMPRTAQLYASNCQGCHGEFGSSAAEIPTLAGRVGYFTRIPEGRRYLVQVPNVALNMNSDADIAAVLNWLLTTYSRAQLPADFKPYTASEVGELRKARIDVAVSRRRVVDALVAAGQIPSADVLALPHVVLY
jgi:mono/diheme cytochrome c family protein